MLEDGFLVIWELVHHLLCKLTDLGLTISVGCFAVKGPNTLCTSRLRVIEGITQGCLALLILDFDESFVLLDQIVAHLQLAVSRSKVKSCVSEFILVVDPAVLFFAKHIHHLEVARFGSRIERRFTELVLDCGSKATFQVIVNRFRLGPFGSIMEQTVSESVLEGQWVHSTLVEFDDVDVPIGSAEEHDLSWTFAQSVDTKLPQHRFSLQPTFDLLEFILYLLWCLIVFLKLALLRSSLFLVFEIVLFIFLGLRFFHL